VFRLVGTDFLQQESFRVSTLPPPLCAVAYQPRAGSSHFVLLVSFSWQEHLAVRMLARANAPLLSSLNNS